MRILSLIGAISLLHVSSVAAGPRVKLAVGEIRVLLPATQSQPDPKPWDGEEIPRLSLPAIPTDLALGVQEMLITDLAATGRYRLLDRTAGGLADVKREAELLRGAASEEGAQWLISGTITEFHWDADSHRESVLTNFRRQEEDLRATVSLELKVTDATTGQIIWSGASTGQSKGAYVQTSLSDQVKTNSFRQCGLGKALRDAIKKGVSSLAKLREHEAWEAKVAAVVDDEGRGTELYLNYGADAGLKVGQSYVVFGTRNGALVRVGQVQLVKVEANSTVAKIINGKEFQIGDVARIPGR